MERENISRGMEPFTKANGYKIKEVGKVENNGQMGQYLMGIT